MRTSVGRRTTGYAVSALCAVALLSACGSDDPQVAPPIGTATPSVSTPAVTPSASGTAAMPSDGRARPTTMTGRVTSVKDGCIVFKNDRDAHRWVLIGQTKGLSVGTAYVIEGVAMDTMDDRCDDALPFHVAKATEGDFIEDLMPLPSATKGTGPAARPMTLTGVVAEGVESGCRVIQTDQGTFVLVGPVTVPDGRVEVTGVRRDDLMSTCQQGPAFEVLTVRPAS